MLGYDARLQFLHEDDLLGALHHATLGGVHGTFNVAGDGVLMLSQALRRLGRPTVPVPGFALSAAGTVTRQAGIERLQAELTGFLTFGRGLDTTPDAHRARASAPTTPPPRRSPTSAARSRRACCRSRLRTGRPRRDRRRWPWLTPR